jgi:2-amino-4-hydroxy-6-hydroxymethyldihydropteridine diphosphokinase
MRYGLALGSNLGDRRENLTKARRLLLERSADPTSLLCAGLYESEPVDCEPGAPPFLNTCLELELDLPPAELHELTRGIENALGRPEQRFTNAPRTIDIDILYAGDLTLSEPDLQIPHPRIAQRRFVLEPLAKIRPDLTLPGKNRTVTELLQELDTGEPPLALAANQW